MKECPKSKLQEKEENLLSIFHALKFTRQLLTDVWYMCGTENVEMQPFKGIFEFCLNISSYVKINFSEPSMHKSRKWNIFYRLYK